MFSQLELKRKDSIRKVDNLINFVNIVLKNYNMTCQGLGDFKIIKGTRMLSTIFLSHLVPMN